MLVTINGFTYRNTIAVMGGNYLLGVSAENRRRGCRSRRQGQGRARLDAAPRVCPFRPTSLRGSTACQRTRTFEGLSYSNESCSPIEGAKTDDTRQRRIAKSVEALREGRIR